MLKHWQTSEAGAACRWGSAVAAYVQGEMAGDELSLFSGHLEHCPSCRAQIRETDGVIAALRQLPAESVVGDLSLIHISEPTGPY